MNIAVVGSVDAGKSTLISVLTNNIKDDGNGSARNIILVHPHEKSSGRTSDVGYHPLNFYAESDVNSSKNTLLLSDNNHNQPHLHLLDLAGHEAYLKTTLRGLTQYAPSFALVAVSLSKGPTDITTEHLTICRTLGIPIILVFTKCDLVLSTNNDENLSKKSHEDLMLNETGINNLKNTICIMKSISIKFSYDAKQEKVMEKFLNSPFNVCPYFIISSKLGYQIDMLRLFLMKLQHYHLGNTTLNTDFTLNLRSPKDTMKNKILTFCRDKKIKNLLFVYRPFFVEGVGQILHGLNMCGTINKNDKLYLGPINNTFHQIKIRSINDEARKDTACLLEGYSGCLSYRYICEEPKCPRTSLYNGKVLINVEANSGLDTCLSKHIQVDLYVLKPRVTIWLGYNPIFHFGNLTVPGVVKKLVEKVKTEYSLSDTAQDFPLRMGDRALLEIELKHKAFLYPGCKFIFRDGGIKGYGIVTKLIS